MKINFIQQKAEDYFAGVSEETYDLVFASHALHFVALETVSLIAMSVRHGGHFVVVIGARNSIMSTLKDLFVPVPAITGEDILKGMETCQSGLVAAEPVSCVPKFQVSGSKFQVPGFKFQVSGSKFQVPSFRFQVSGFKFQGKECGLTAWIPRYARNDWKKIKFKISNLRSNVL